jgi:transcription antitermination factor NusG
LKTGLIFLPGWSTFAKMTCERFHALSLRCDSTAIASILFGSWPTTARHQTACACSLDKNGEHRIDNEAGLSNSSLVSELLWFVAHARPRREKKIVEYCLRQGIAATLPCYNSAHKYRGKTVVFRKPLFPGYVFLQLAPGQKDSIRQNEHVGNLLDVFDQETFRRQLEDILLALETDLEVRLAPTIGEGMRVRIKSGPLQGLEGWVEQRYGTTTVLLRLNFINQAAAVKIDVDQLIPS